MSAVFEYPLELLILLFLVVTFFQSSIDKITDWNGNLEFIREHFQNSPLKNMVPLLLGIILLMEFAASLLMIVGGIQIVMIGMKDFSIYGIELSALCLIFLLFGQRLAKDYAGAMTLAVYFIITILGLYVMVDFG